MRQPCPPDRRPQDPIDDAQRQKQAGSQAPALSARRGGQPEQPEKRQNCDPCDNRDDGPMPCSVPASYNNRTSWKRSSPSRCQRACRCSRLRPGRVHISHRRSKRGDPARRLINHSRAPSTALSPPHSSHQGVSRSWNCHGTCSSDPAWPWRRAASRERSSTRRT